MKTELSKEWCMRMAQLEGDAEIGAGLVAINPVFDEGEPAHPSDQIGYERDGENICLECGQSAEDQTSWRDLYAGEVHDDALCSSCHMLLGGTVAS